MVSKTEVVKAHSRYLLWLSLFRDAIQSNDSIIKDDLFLKAVDKRREYEQIRKQFLNK